MPEVIKLKRSGTAAKVPTAGQLELGELAVNTADGRLFLKKADGTVVDVTSIPGIAGLSEALAGKVATDDARLADSREWTAATVSQAEAEAGAATTRRAWTAQRVRQAVAAWWVSASSAWGRGLVTSADAASGRQALVLDHPTLRQYGGLNDGTTNADTALAAAIAAGKQFNLPAGDYLVTGISNLLGVEMPGDGRLLKAITGGHQQLNSAADVGQHVFGQEYLYAFHERLRNKQPSTILCSGDSTTSGGYAGLDAGFYIHELLMDRGFEAGHNITAVNGGHAMKHTGEWVSDYLTADLATNPDLYVIRWGINDPWAGRSISQFATSLRAGLQQIRSSKTLSQMSVLLMAPNSTSDTPNNRDERWYEQARLVCRQAARDYQCAFIDTYSLWKDSRPAATRWMDDPFGDGRAIHPKNVMNAWIVSAMAALLFPAALVNRMPAANTALAALPSTYPYGWSTAGATDFPVPSCTVMTYRNRMGGCLQIVFSNFAAAGLGGYPGAQLAIRSGLYLPAVSIDAWYDWTSRPSVSIPPQNGWVAFGTGTNEPRASKNGQVVTLSGAVKNGTITAGTVIGTLPVGFRPRNDGEHYLVATNVTTTAAVCRLAINTAGQITIIAGANAAAVYLGSISFEAGA